MKRFAVKKVHSTKYRVVDQMVGKAVKDFKKKASATRSKIQRNARDGRHK